MKDVLNYLFDYNTLDYQQSKQLLINISKGEYNPYQVVSFMTIFNMRAPTIDELKGFRDAMLDTALDLDLSEFDFVDLCGTGGDKKDTFNISTIASFIVAGAGYKVVKHGNYGVSSNCGSSNVLERLGYSFKSNLDSIKKELDTVGITFIHAPMFHPSMKNVAMLRKNIKVRTFFNMLGPMVNPAKPNNQLVGVFSLELARIYNYIYQESTKKYSIVYSLDGYDEISLTAPFKVYSNNRESILSNQYFGIPNNITSDSIKNDGITPAEDILINILESKGIESHNQVVIANAAMAIKTISNKSIQQSIEQARDSLFSGKALSIMKKII